MLPADPDGLSGKSRVLPSFWLSLELVSRARFLEKGTKYASLGTKLASQYVSHYMQPKATSCRFDFSFWCFSDPYVRVSFCNQSQVSEVMHRTLCPIWDQTIIFENVFIYGSPEITEKSPPQVVIEVFDEDPVVRCLSKVYLPLDTSMVLYPKCRRCFNDGVSLVQF